MALSFVRRVKSRQNGLTERIRKGELQNTIKERGGWTD